jgi:hypothetical protein
MGSGNAFMEWTGKRPLALIGIRDRVKTYSIKTLLLIFLSLCQPRDETSFDQI